MHGWLSAGGNTGQPPLASNKRCPTAGSKPSCLANCFLRATCLLPCHALLPYACCHTPVAIRECANFDVALARLHQIGRSPGLVLWRCRSVALPSPSPCRDSRASATTVPRHGSRGKRCDCRPLLFSDAWQVAGHIAAHIAEHSAAKAAAHPGRLHRRVWRSEKGTLRCPARQPKYQNATAQAARCLSHWRA